jgi:MOSC domain-containing protein YiiM
MLIEIKHLFVSSGHDFKGRHGKEALNHGIEDRDEIECVTGRGITGDRYFDFKEDFKGQITFFDLAVYDAVKEQFSLPDLEPTAFRRNVLLAGVDLNSLIEKRFRIGELEFEGSEEAKPCAWMNQACAPGVEEFLRGKGGLRARIRQGGTLHRGAAELLGA